MTKGDKGRQKRKRQKRDLRDTTVRALAMSGKSGQEIADAVGLSRQRVSKILNSEETKSILKNAESKITEMIDEAIATVMEAMAGRGDLTPGAMANALKAALSVLKTRGVIKDNVDLNHNFPKPTIIERRDGSEEILGAVIDTEGTE